MGHVTSGRAEGERYAWAFLGFSALLVLALSRILTPSVSGVGTHLQLGLPPCLFSAWFDLRCPACGLTTAFALLAHGELRLSLRAHPLGFFLFAVTAAIVPLSCWGLWRAASLRAFCAWIRVERAALFLGWAFALVWLLRLN